MTIKSPLGTTLNESMVELTTKLFAHINNDAELVGTRELEGNDFRATAGFLSHFISEIANDTVHFPESLLSKVELDVLKNKVSGLTDRFQFIKPLILRTGDDGFVRYKARKSIDPIVQDIMDIPAGDKSKGVLLPGGWSGASGAHGHAMLYEFRKDKEGNILFIVYNSGAGINYHAAADSLDKDRYNSVKTYKIPNGPDLDKKIAYFVRELIRPRVEPLENDPGVTSSDKIFDAKKLYTEIFPKIAYCDGYEIPPKEADPSFNELMTMGQRSGTCTEKVLHEFIKGNFKDEKSAKYFIFCLKKYAIEYFYAQNAQNLNKEKRDQIQFAIENLARKVDKIASEASEGNPGEDKAVVEEEIEKNIEETYSLIRTIHEALAQQKESPLPQSLNLPSLPATLSPVKTKIINGSIPLDIKEALPHENNSAFLQEKILFVMPVTINHLNDFMEAIKKRRGENAPGIHELLVDSLDKMLLNLPLNQDGYRDIDSPLKAAQFLELMRELLMLYGESCHMVDSANVLGPQRVIVLLSALSAMTVGTQKQELSVIGKGISSQFYDNIKILLSIYNHSALMSSKNPILDARLEEMRQLANEVQTPKYSMENSFDFYTAMIDSHPQKDDFVKYLLDLFNNNAPTQFQDKPGLMDLVRVRHKEAEVALAVLMNATNTPEIYKLELEKCQNKVKYESLSDRILKTLSGFDYASLKSKDPLKDHASIIHDINTYNRRLDSFDYEGITNVSINERLSEYGIKLQNKHISAPLFCKWNAVYSNKIYTLVPDGLEDELGLNRRRNADDRAKSDGQNLTHTKENEYLRMLWELRVDPDSSILHTIDYFDENLQLLADPDYQQYLVKNIFDPSALLACLKNNPEAYATIEQFIQRGIRMSELDNKDQKTTLYFYTLEYQLNQYILRMPIEEIKGKYYDKSLAKLKALKTKVSERKHVFLEPGTHLPLAQLQLNMDIVLNQCHELEINKDSLFRIFDQTMEYLTALKSKIDITAEELDEDKFIRENVYKILWRDQGLLSEVFLNWCSHHIHPERDLTHHSVEINFPYLVLYDKENHVVISCDLVSGRLTQADQPDLPTGVPLKLARSRLYKTFDKQNVSQTGYITPVKCGNGQESYKIEIANAVPKHYYVETPFLNQPYALHCEKALNGQRDFYELQSISTYNSSLGMLEASKLGSQSCYMPLPMTFFCETTQFWRGVQNPDVAIIERADHAFSVKQDEVELLDSDHQGTGYLLVHPKNMDTSDPLKPQMEALYRCFRNFEDNELTEIYYQKNAGSKPELKILFPRYGLTLHANLSPLQIWDAKNEDWELTEDQQTPFGNFKAPLVFQHKITSERKAVVPLQEFYAPKKSELTSKAANDESYYPFIYDINFTIKKAFLEDPSTVGQKSQISPSFTGKPWKMVNTEQTMEVTWDNDLQLVNAKGNKDKLTLAYIYLCRFQPEKALPHLMEISHSGGLTGTLEELSLIEKICNGVPRLSKEGIISNPRYIAVKAHAIALVSHFLEKGNKLPLPTNPYDKFAESKEEIIKAFEYDRLKTFYIGQAPEKTDEAGLLDVMQNSLNSYLHNINNIPSHMQLSVAQEFEMLRYIHKNTKAQEAIGARYESLKADYLKKELAYLHGLNLSPTELANRQENIEKQLKKDKVILKHTYEVDTSADIQIPIVTPSTLSYKSPDEDKKRIQSSLEGGWDKPKNALPRLSMTYSEFCNQFKYYYKFAFEPNSDEKASIQIFCEQTTLANLYIDKDVSVVAHLAGILLKAYANPNEFKDIQNLSFQERDFDTTIDKLFSKAASVNFSVTTKGISRALTKEIPLKEEIPSPVMSAEAIHAGPFSYSVKYAAHDLFSKTIALKKAECDKAIEKLIETVYPKTGTFEENADKIKELDIAIGEMRNSFHVEILRYTKKAMDPQYFNPEKEFEKSLRLELDVKEDIKALETTMIDLVNQYPIDPKAKRTKELREMGRTRGNITLAELNRLYVLADKNEYRRATGLKDEDIVKLHQNMSDYIQLGLYEQANRRKSEALKYYIALKNDPLTPPTDLESAIAKLSEVALGQNLADVSKEPEIQYFQYADNKILYSQQMHYLQELLTRDDLTQKYKNTIIKLIMGGGKSKVLAPLALLKKANGTNLAIMQVKRGLFNTNFADLSSTSMRLFGQEAVAFQFDRQSPISSKDLKALYRKLQAVKVERKYLVTTGESLQSLELKYCELLFVDAKNRSEEWKSQIKWIERCLDLLKNSGDRIIDEIHDELNPNIQLNYTLGDSLSIPQEDIALELKLFDFFSQVDITDIVHTMSADEEIKHQKITLEDLLKNNKLITDKDQWNRVFSRLAEQLESHPQSPVAPLISKLQYDPKDKQFSAYFLNQSDTAIDRFQDTLSDRDLDELAFLKSQVTGILPFTLKRNLYEDYGPWPETDARKSYLEKMLPIPYKSNNTPNTRARFGNYIENMNYVMLMNAQMEFSDLLIGEIIDEFVALAKSEIIQDSNLSFNETNASKMLNAQFEASNKIDLNKWAQQPPGVRDPGDLERIKSSKKFRLYCIRDRILPQLQLNPEVLSSNPQNSVSMTNTTQGMSGTPNNFRAMHQDLIYDEKKGLGTDGETLALLKSKLTSAYLCEKTNAAADIKPDDLLSLLMRKSPDHMRNLRSIIDVGSLFRGIDNLTVAQKIIQFYQVHDPDALSKIITSADPREPAKEKNKIQYILYFDNKLEVLCALDILNPEVPIILNTTDEAEIKAKLKCTSAEWFTYYDQARATGTDIAQAPKAHAIVTYSEKTKQSPALQGIKRMRKFTQDQTVTLIGPPYLDSLFEQSISPTDQSIPLDKVLSLFSNNEYADELKVHLRGTLQKFENVIRENLLHKISSESNPERKADLFKITKDYFVRQYKPTHFKNAGSVTTLDDTLIYFQNCLNQHYNNWKKLLTIANIPIEYLDELSVTNALNKVMSQGISACAAQTEQSRRKVSEDMTALIPDAGLGVQVEIETETEREIEIQLELETEQVFYEKTQTPYSNIQNAFKFDESNPLVPVQSAANNHYNFYSLNEALESHPKVPSFRFSNQILMSDLFAHTYYNQNQILSSHTKPVHNILMIQEKQSPFALKAILLNKSESAYYNPMPTYSKYDVWMISPKNTLISGDRPTTPSPDIALILEQIRYFNGDCKLLAEQKTPSVWLGEQKEEKLAFMEKALLPIHLTKKPYFNQLKNRLSLIYNATQYIHNHPDEDFFKPESAQKIRGFQNLSPDKQRLYISSAIASILFSKVEDFNHLTSLQFKEKFSDDWVKAQTQNDEHLKNNLIFESLKAKRDEIFHGIQSNENRLCWLLAKCVTENKPIPIDFPFGSLNTDILLSTPTIGCQDILTLAENEYNASIIQTLTEKYSLSQSVYKEPNNPDNLNVYTSMLLNAINGLLRIKADETKPISKVANLHNRLFGKGSVQQKKLNLDQIQSIFLNPKAPVPIEFNKLFSADILQLNKSTINDSEKQLYNALLSAWVNQQKEKGASLNEVTSQGETALMIAVRLENVAMVEEILSFHADSNIKNSKNENAISLLIKNGRLNAEESKKILLLLLSADTEAENIKIVDLGKIYDKATKAKILQFWKTAVIQKPESINDKNANGKSLIEEYFDTDAFDVENINSLLDAGADLNQTNTDNRSLFTLMLKNLIKLPNDNQISKLHRFDSIANETVDNAISDMKGWYYSNKEKTILTNQLLDKWLETIKSEVTSSQDKSVVRDMVPLLKRAIEYQREDIIKDIIAMATHNQDINCQLEKCPGLQALQIPEDANTISILKVFKEALSDETHLDVDAYSQKYNSDWISQHDRSIQGIVAQNINKHLETAQRAEMHKVVPFVEAIMKGNPLSMIESLSSKPIL